MVVEREGRNGKLPEVNHAWNKVQLFSDYTQHYGPEIYIHRDQQAQLGRQLSRKQRAYLESFHFGSFLLVFDK
jgi:hypothetical protein